MVHTYRQNYKSHTELRNKPNPNDDLELAYQQVEAEVAADRLIEKYSTEPQFLRAMLTEAVRKITRKAERTIDGDQNDILE
jgi:cell fate (sporulation/competence/biofilm development) regulator YlbF (YheA/YmcA/DUF963 family)